MKLSVERVGGLAGFGPGSRVRSRGEVDWSTLPDADRNAVDALFGGAGAKAKDRLIADGFRYRLTRAGTTVEVLEAAVPPSIRDCVRDELD